MNKYDNCTTIISVLLNGKVQYKYNIILLIIQIIIGIASIFYLKYILLLIIIIYIQEYLEILSKLNLSMEILKCSINQLCYGPSVNFDRKLKLIIKGIILYLEPFRYFSDGYLILDSVCLNMYHDINKYLTEIAALPSFIDVTKHLLYKNYLFFLIIFIIIVLYKKK